MENKELEKLVEDVSKVLVSDDPNIMKLMTIRSALKLADKQGYMRGQKEVLLRVVDELYNVLPTGTVSAFDMIKAIEEYRQKLDKEAQFHDAISKLKEV